MRVASVRLRNFKRFTDLEISGVPETAKLVVVVGPNGCGKSSLFDAFLQWYRGHAGFGIGSDDAYYQKDPAQPLQWNKSVTVVLHGGATPKKGSFYIRTAYRNDPDFAISGFNRPAVPSDEVRVNRAIDNDQTVSMNYQRLVYDTMSGVYDTANDDRSVHDLREELIGDLRSSMKNVFGDLLLNSISDPLGSGAFFFEKGTATNYHYKNLSGGEKAAFDLLLDLHVKRRYFQDAVYCVDEVETHLHTRVQGDVVREMVNILPDGCQLWVTTHSLGVLRAAQAMNAKEPGSVCLIDFDAVDPDVPRELGPSNLNRVSWEKLLSLTLDDLSPQIAPKCVVVCEGSSVGSRRKDFDAEIYSRVLGTHFPDVMFMSGGSSNQVAASGVEVGSALSQIMPASRVVALADRDERSDPEVADFERNGNLILPVRNLEAFLFADDILEALAKSANKEELYEEALQVKKDAVAASVARGHREDDLKSAAGTLCVELRKLFALERSGNNADSFMRDTLAPLIEPSMPTYQQMKAGIIDRL